MNEEQKMWLQKLVNEGLTLGQIQDKMATYGWEGTYMQLRFIIDDLGLILQNKPTPKPAPNLDSLAKNNTPKSAQAPLTDDSLAQEEPPLPSSSVSVEVDNVVRPGAMVSGSVTFGDGVKTAWTLDEFGRLGLVGAPAGYKPNQEDILEFQTQLRGLLQARGI